mmetsp:Transcript_6105/g.21425  ORF Transcript_6105/g.21425 Transcript_6105/m.21425 type:complete len:780 (+) Transcript_6105:195-2534(+)
MTHLIENLVDLHSVAIGELVTSRQESPRLPSGLTLEPVAYQGPYVFETKYGREPRETAHEAETKLNVKPHTVQTRDSVEEDNMRARIPLSLNREEKRKKRKELLNRLQGLESVLHKLEDKKRQVNVRDGNKLSGRVVVTATALPERRLLSSKRTPKPNSVWMGEDYEVDMSHLPAEIGRAHKRNSAALRTSTGFDSSREEHGRTNRNKRKTPDFEIKQSQPNSMREAKQREVLSEREKRRKKLMRACEAALKDVSRHTFSWIFAEPVNTVALGLFDYHTIIKQPMDFGTISKKLKGGAYNTAAEFCSDMRLVFSNCATYNKPDTDAAKMGVSVHQHFEARWRAIQDELDGEEQRQRDEDVAIAQTPADAFTEQQHLPEQVNYSPKHPATATIGATTRLMTYEEKCQLSETLTNLPQDKINRVIQIIQERNAIQPDTSDGEIELELEALDNDTLWRLQSFVSSTATRQQPEVNHSYFEKCSNVVSVQDGLPLVQPSSVDVDKMKIAPSSSKSSSSSTSSSSSSSDSQSAKKMSEEGADSAPCKITTEEPGNVKSMLPQKHSTLVEASVTRPVGDASQIIRNGPQQSVVAIQNVDSWSKLNDSNDVQQNELKAQAHPEHNTAQDDLLLEFKKREQEQKQRAKDRVEYQKALDHARQKKEQEVKAEYEKLRQEAEEAEATERVAKLEAREEAKREREMARAKARADIQKMQQSIHLEEQREMMTEFGKQEFGGEWGTANPIQQMDSIRGTKDSSDMNKACLHAGNEQQAAKGSSSSSSSSSS